MTYIKRCKVYSETKPLQQSPPGYLGFRSLVDKPWQMVCCDIVGPSLKGKLCNRFVYVVFETITENSCFLTL